MKKQKSIQQKVALRLKTKAPKVIRDKKTYTRKSKHGGKYMT